MIVFVVDANLLIYAADQDFPRQSEIQTLISEWGQSTEQWFVTWSIVYEFLSVTTQRNIFAHPLTFADSWSFIEAMLGFPSFAILMETDRHTEVVRDLLREHRHMAGTRFHDLHIAAVMREHGITDIRTADADFHQFKFLRVTNPLAYRSRG